MPWPWVSRARLEDVQRRFDAVDAERQQLLAELLSVQTVEPVKPTTINESQQSSVNGPTPHDRVLNRFESTFRGKTIPQQFKARLR